MTSMLSAAFLAAICVPAVLGAEVIDLTEATVPAARKYLVEVLERDLRDAQDRLAETRRKRGTKEEIDALQQRLAFLRRVKEGIGDWQWDGIAEGYMAMMNVAPPNQKKEETRLIYPLTIDEILGPQEFLASVEIEKGVTRQFVFRGISTKALGPKDTIFLRGAFEVIGQRKARGRDAKDVKEAWVIEPFRRKNTASGSIAP